MRESTPATSDVVARDHADLTSLVEARLGRRPARLESIPAGLGNRRFHRLHFESGSPRSLIARVEPDPSTLRPAAAVHPRVPEAPPWLPEPGLEPIRTFLEEHGLRVPKSYAHLPEAGIDLLEDVGDRTLLSAPASERAPLYRDACDIIARLQALQADPSEIPAFGRRFDRALLETKAWKWLHWTIPLLLHREATPDEIEGLDRLFERIAELVEDAPRRLSHRDFKAENLHLVAGAPDGPARGTLVMIDVQGAFMAPPEYDLVCLLCDLQVELDERFVRDTLQEMLPRLPDAPSLAEGRLRFDALACARLCKDVSHVVHAGCIKGDLRRWHEIPGGLRLLLRAAEGITPTFTEARTLTSVIQALTPEVLCADSRDRGEKRR